jgi:hypothetical protein
MPCKCVRRRGSSSISMLQQLAAHGLQVTTACYASALAAGHVALCDWLLAAGVPLPPLHRVSVPHSEVYDGTAAVHAARASQLPSLTWLMKASGADVPGTAALHDMSWLELAEAAAEGGCVELLRYVLALPVKGGLLRGEQLRPRVVERAAMKAARTGQPAALRYLVEVCSTSVACCAKAQLSDVEAA